MIFFRNTILFKSIAIASSLLIVVLILWNTYIFFQNFKKEERLKMELFAAAVKEFATNPNLDDNFYIEGKIIESNTNIPTILVDENEKITSWENLDPLKTKRPEYLQEQLELMKSENKPIIINFSGDKTNKVFYRDSDILNKLTYYPLALVLILILFLSVIYLFYNSNKIAEANKLWTGMAKETAHQIGTPLSSLLGWIAILKSENVDETYIKEIEKDVDRLNIIANRFSKIGSVPELKKENIVLVSKTAFEYLESRSSKQIDFQFSSTLKKIDTKLNEELFGWVIENLIKNAIDAMSGKGSLFFSIEDDQKRIKILVTDSGKGIPKNKFKQIFQPGYTTKTRGWGLGLSLSKRIIEDYHDGKIFVKTSEIGKGTTFQITINKS
jgi:two-component sensor histidine kinase